MVAPNLEPDAKTHGGPDPTELVFPSEGVCLYSIAISLKRIADALEERGPLPLAEQIVGALSMPLNHYGEAIGECIQGQHERGLRGIPNP